MKRWLGKALFVLGTPAASFGLLSLGEGLRDSMGGRLLQITGGFLGMIWLTGTFLIVGAALSTGSGYRAADTTASPPIAEVTSKHAPKETEEESET